MRPARTSLSVFLVLCVGTYGCHGRDRNGDGVVKIACVGDSNTDPHFTPEDPSWCELVAAAHPNWQFVNRGAVFSTAASPEGCVLCGRYLLNQALTEDHVDLVLIALGTNDLASAWLRADATVNALIALRDAAIAANVEAAIAMIPPVINGRVGVTRRINAANALLGARIPAGALVDFFSGMQPVFFLCDGVHVNGAGKRKRAEAADRYLTHHWPG
jgi:lysophospholipase L1-like esterase